MGPAPTWLSDTALSTKRGAGIRLGSCFSTGFIGATFRFVTISPKAKACPQWMLAPKSEPQAISKWGDFLISKVAAGSKQGGRLCRHRISKDPTAYGGGGRGRHKTWSCLSWLCQVIDKDTSCAVAVECWMHIFYYPFLL